MTSLKRITYKKKIHEDFFYVEIYKSMYGLPHAGKFPNDRLVKELAKHGYHTDPHTNGLFVNDK